MVRKSIYTGRGRKKKSDPKKERSLVFNCTACAQPQLLVQGKRNILCHPQLKVGVCWDCLVFAHSDIVPVDGTGSEIYCTWCSEVGMMVCCGKCMTPYCKDCITRNIGSEYYESASGSNHWECFACDPNVISDLLDLTKAALDHQNFTDTSDYLIEKCAAPFEGDPVTNDSDREEIISERLRIRKMLDFDSKSDIALCSVSDNLKIKIEMSKLKAGKKLLNTPSRKLLLRVRNL